VKAIAVITNFFIPGLGSLVIGKLFQGLLQLLLVGLAALFNFTVIGLIVGIPLYAIAWIWGLITAATYGEPARMAYDRR
jgi:TM2 domain-containing membrane protein YozV